MESKLTENNSKKKIPARISKRFSTSKRPGKTKSLKKNKDQSFHVTFETWDQILKTVDEAKKHDLIKKLKILANDLDPYQDQSSEMILLLKEFNLHKISDPFELTNKILLMLENALSGPLFNNESPALNLSSHVKKSHEETIQ